MSERPKVSRRLVMDTAWALVGLGGPTVLQLLYVVAAARALGAEQFGQLMLIIAVSTVFGTLSGLGIDGVALKAVARNAEAVSAEFGRAIGLILVSALPLTILAVIASQFLSRAPFPLWSCLSLAVAEILFLRIAQACQRVFIARSEQFRAAVVGMFIPFGRLFTAIIILLNSQYATLELFTVTYLVATLLCLVAALRYTFGGKRFVSFDFRSIHLKEGISFMLIWLNSSLQVECDKLILSFYTSPAAVGVYSLASRLMDGAFNPPRALRISLQGRMMREGAKGHLAMYRFMIRILPLSIAYGLFAWAAIALAAPYVVHVFGPQYADLARILPLMGALPLLRSIADIGAELFVASDRVSLSTIVQILVTLLRIIVGILLIRSGGINGAVGSALLATALAAIIFWVVALVLTRRHTAIEKADQQADP